MEEDEVEDEGEAEEEEAEEGYELERNHLCGSVVTEKTK